MDLDPRAFWIYPIIPGSIGYIIMVYDTCGAKTNIMVPHVYYNPPNRYQFIRENRFLAFSMVKEITRLFAVNANYLVLDIRLLCSRNLNSLCSMPIESDLDNHNSDTSHDEVIAFDKYVPNRYFACIYILFIIYYTLQKVNLVILKNSYHILIHFCN